MPAPLGTTREIKGHCQVLSGPKFLFCNRLLWQPGSSAGQVSHWNGRRAVSEQGCSVWPGRKSNLEWSWAFKMDISIQYYFVPQFPLSADWGCLFLPSSYLFLCSKKADF